MRIVLVTLLCASLCACALNPLQKDKGNPAYDEKIASDTVMQLARLYPPAKTQFNLEASSPTSFAALLAEKLRAKGYAISESRPAKTGFRTILTGNTLGDVSPLRPAIAAPSSSVPAAPHAPGIELRYVLDYSATVDLSRITLKVGKNSLLARAYVSDNGILAPAGAWTFKE